MPVLLVIPDPFSSVSTTFSLISFSTRLVLSTLFYSSSCFRSHLQLEVYLNGLRSLRSRWESYVAERDALRSWLTGRMTASRHLVETKSRSSQPKSEEVRALEHPEQVKHDSCVLQWPTVREESSIGSRPDIIHFIS
ncbi:unnamed protein product [Protopolystoma xenopodis]|uniref:Uncharacterized protein n=1 Tax=Protopolystoma xenopodis TaxID=117903 RepID=A0A448X5T9_9PLAT|nr:unnamed protein product [Protopolystoma xenopodis]